MITPDLRMRTSHQNTGLRIVDHVRTTSEGLRIYRMKSLLFPRGDILQSIKYEIFPLQAFGVALTRGAPHNIVPFIKHLPFINYLAFLMYFSYSGRVQRGARQMTLACSCKSEVCLLRARLGGTHLVGSHLRGTRLRRNILGITTTPQFLAIVYNKRNSFSFCDFSHSRAHPDFRTDSYSL